MVYSKDGFIAEDHDVSLLPAWGKATKRTTDGWNVGV
jgi:hypothetical protein